MRLLRSLYRNRDTGSARLSLLVTLLVFAFLPLLAFAAGPSWWQSANPPILNPNANAQPDDFAALNQGELKNFAYAAMNELDADLPGGAGDAVHAMINGWLANENGSSSIAGGPAPTGTPDDYAVVNLGELKAVAQPFYDRLMQAGYCTGYPWDQQQASGGFLQADDYATANIGQMKNLFNYDVTYDSTGDGLPDWWALHYFGTLNVDPSATLQSTGTTVLQAYQQRLNPSAVQLYAGPGNSSNVQSSPGTTSIFINQPQFDGVPMPPEYQGLSVEQLTKAAPAITCSLAAPTSAQLKTWTTIDNSPELREHPLLDQLVASMTTSEYPNGDPMAIANYVQNQIGLCDALSYDANGNLTDQSINQGGVGRSALGVYLEAEGNPAEQCALLIYMLRKAGIPCGYVFGGADQTLMFASTLSNLLHMQLVGGAGVPTNNTLIFVNYPWVAAYLNGSWVQLFPWIKDTAIVQGQDLYSQLPSGYQSGIEWLWNYLIDDPIARSYPAFCSADIVGAQNLINLFTNTNPDIITQILYESFPTEVQTAFQTATSPEQQEAALMQGFNDILYTAAYAQQIDNAEGTGSTYQSYIIDLLWDLYYNNPNLTSQSAALFQQIQNLIYPPSGTASQWPNSYDAMRVFYWLIQEYYTPYIAIHSTMTGETSGDNPGILFPFFVQSALQANGSSLSIADIGVQIYNRPHEYTSWSDFPRPYQVAAVGTNNFFASLSATPLDSKTAIPLIFDTLTVSVTNQSGDNLIQTSALRLCDLFDRRFLLYSEQTGANTHVISLSLESYGDVNDTGSTVGKFADDDPLLYPQLLQAGISGAKDNALSVTFTYNRNKAVSSSDQGSLDYLGVYNTLSTIITRPYFKGDMAAICLNYGQVTSSMIQYQAQKYWASQQAAVANNKTAVTLETAQGLPIFLMGLNYYHQVGTFASQMAALSQTSLVTFNGIGLARLGAQRDSTGVLPNNGQITYVWPGTDMFYNVFAYAGNGTLHPNGSNNYITEIQNWAPIVAGEISAQEHVTLNQFFQQTSAVSTVKLFDLSLANGNGLYALNSSNYEQLGATVPPGHTQTLSQLAGAGATGSQNDLWDTIKAELSPSNPYASYTVVLLTPGPQTNQGFAVSSSGAFYGMAAFILDPSKYSALITNNLGSTTNGGDLSISEPIMNPDQTSTTPTNLDQTLGQNYIAINDSGTSCLQSYAGISSGSSPSTVTLSQSASPTAMVLQLNSVGAQISVSGQSSLTISSDSQTSLTLEQYTSTVQLDGTSPNLGNFSTYSSTLTSLANIGYLGATAYLGNLVNQVADPVDALTGNFYIDATDLALPGPLPLQFRRNYLSQNVIDNGMGYGWKPSITPYLVVSTDTNHTLIYAAEMDGSVIAYRRQQNSGGAYTNRWIPEPVDNPQLVNMNHGSSGSVANMYNNTLTLTSSGGSGDPLSTNNSVLLLNGADGSVRTFVINSFPMVGNSSVTRQRPYLTKWTDSKGNYYTFTFGAANSSLNYGYLSKINASNGNSITFNYDTNGHVIEAYAGDGRIVYYGYDAYGDLTQVIRPDGSTIGYKYEHLQQQQTTSSAPSQLGAITFYSDHLLIEEDSPEGRVLQNVYDSPTTRRVVQQWATVGTTSSPVQNATFTYNNSENDDGTFSGYTRIVDVLGHHTDYYYQENEITSIVDPNGNIIKQTWYPSSGNSGGAYTRSLKSVIDKRGLQTSYQYDSNGNLIQIQVTGDLTGINPNDPGITTGTATTTMQYTGDSRNLVTNITDPLGNQINYTYDTTYTYLPASIQHVSGGITISNQQFTYESVGSGAVFANGVLKSETTSVLNQTSGAAETDYTYTANGFIASTTQQTGTADLPVTMNYTHDERGQVITATDAMGRTTTYAYDAMGRKISEQCFDANQNPIVRNYYYTQNGEPQWSDGPAYNPESYTYMGYDLAGRRNQTIQWLTQASADGSGVEAGAGNGAYATTLYSYDAFGNVVQTQDPNGNITTMHYDPLGQMLSKSSPDGQGNTVTESYLYEPGGQISQYTNPLGGITSTTYTSRGQPEQQTNPDGSVVQWQYDLTGRVLSKTLNTSLVSSFIYSDAQCTVTHTLTSGSSQMTETSTYDGLGNLISKTDVDGYTVTNTYDNLNRVSTSTGPSQSNQQIITHRYGAAGQWHFVSISGSDGSVIETTNTQYDMLRRPLWVNNTRSATSLHTTYTYAADGQSVTITNGTGVEAISVTRYMDSRGKPVLTCFADGSFQRQVYDASGNPTASFDELGHKISFVYDGLNRMIRQVLPDGATTSFVRDAAGNVLQRQMPGGLVAVALYDTASRISSEELQGGGQSTRQYSYTFYPAGTPQAGKLEAVNDPRGFSIYYTYDAFLRLSETKTPLTAGSPLTQDTTFVRNNRGLATQITQSDQVNEWWMTSTIDRTYDGYAQLTQERVTEASNGTNLSYSVDQNFDSSGLRVSAEYDVTPSTGGSHWRQTRRYGYVAGGLVSGISANTTLPSGLSGPTSSYSFTYGDNGLLSSRTTPMSLQSIARDTRGRITSQTITAPNWSYSGAHGQTLLTESLGWNSNSQLNSYQATSNTSQWWRNPVTVNSRYGYDVRGRTRTEGNTAYSFDGNRAGGLGVRTSASINNDSMVVDSQDAFGEVTQETFIQSTGTTYTYFPTTYDAAGNVTSRLLNVSPSPYKDQMVWDTHNRLLQSAQCRMAYDGIGRRLSLTGPATNGSTTQYSIYDPEMEFGEAATIINGVLTWKVLGPDLNGRLGGLQGIGGVLATVDGATGTVTPVVNDAFGNVVAAFQPTGNPSQPYLLAGNAVTNGTGISAYGATPYTPAAQALTSVVPFSTSNPSQNVAASLTWRSRTIDPSGLYYLGTRYYEPLSGRFMSADPLGHAASMSLHDYVNGDPINSVDPCGRNGSQTGGGPVSSTPFNRDAANAQLAQLRAQFQADQNAANTVWGTLLSWGGNAYFGLTQGVADAAYIEADMLTGGTINGIHSYANGFQGGVYSATRVLTGFGMATGGTAILLSTGGFGGVGYMSVSQLSAPVVYDAAYIGLTNASFWAGATPIGAAVTWGAAGALDNYSQTGSASDALTTGVVSGLLTYVSSGGTIQVRGTSSPSTVSFPRCFPPGTLVLMANGKSKPIETIQEGEEVLADDSPNEGQPTACKVLARLVNFTRHLVNVDVKDSANHWAHFEATREHPFWVKGRGWIAAKDLHTNDLLSDKTGRNVRVLNVSISNVFSQTFNLTVEAKHTFYVSDHDVTILVHNATPFQVGTYSSLNGGINVGDNLAAHEVLPNNYLKALGVTTSDARLGSNPSIALDPDIHAQVNALQTSWGIRNKGYLATLPPEEVVFMNYDFMIQAGVPEAKALQVSQNALNFAYSLGIECP